MQPQKSQKHLTQFENNKVNNRYGTIIKRKILARWNFKLNDFLKHNFETVLFRRFFYYYRHIDRSSLVPLFTHFIDRRL